MNLYYKPGEALTYTTQACSPFGVIIYTETHYIYIYHDGLAHVVLNLQTGELNFFHLLREYYWKRIG